MQGAGFVSRIEGQKTLKLKALTFSTFFSIQDLRLLWGCGELLNSVVAGLPSAQKIHFGCYCTCRLAGFLPCQGDAQHSGVPLGLAMAGIHSHWATQCSPAIVVVSPRSCRLWSPNISLFLPCTGSLLLLPRCTCTAGKRRKGRDPNGGKAHARKSRNPARGEPLRLRDGG